MNNNVKDIL